MNRLRAMLKRHGQPVAMMSVIVDETIAALCTTVESLEKTLAEGKQLTFGDLLRAAGESLDDVKI
jgi:predicted phage tail protein